MPLATYLCQVEGGISAKALRPPSGHPKPSLIKDQQGSPCVLGETSQGKGVDLEVREAVESWTAGGLGVE